MVTASPTTPNIDAVAREAVLFDSVAAPAPLTLPAHSSMLTGTVPPYHGVHHNIDYKLDESNVTLAEILNANGYATGAVISSFVLNRQFGLSQGFDSYNDEFVRPMSSFYHNERRGDETTKFACEWLESHKEEKFFLFVHYYDPHDKYHPPEPYATNFKDDLYAGEISFVDWCIGAVIKKLKNLGLYDSTLLIITSDHGEGLGEHSEPTHGYYIYDSTIRVPLIIKVPGLKEDRKIDEIVALVDIVPTVCGLLGLKKPDVLHGIDLSGILRKNEKPSKDKRYIYCESLMPTQYGCSSLLGIISGRWKYIQAPRAELYDIEEDPGEKENLYNKQPKLARVMKENLKLIVQEQVRTKGSKEYAVDESNRAQLESLGYVDVGISEDFTFDNTKDDPKDWVKLHHQVMWANSYIKVGQFDEAEPVIKGMLTEKPDYILSYFLLGKVALGKSNIIAAVQQFKEFLCRYEKIKENDPDNQILSGFNSKALETYTYIGTIYHQQRNFTKAQTYFMKALELDPDLPETHNNLGGVFLEQLKFDEAILQYKESLRLKPDFQRAQNNLQLVEVRKSQIEQAVKEGEDSLKENPDQPELYETLGVVLYKLGNYEKAISYWEKSVELKPDSASILNSLAWVKASYSNQGFYAPDEAIKLAQKACKITDYKDVSMLDTLSVSYAAAKQMDKAIEIAHRALELARSEGQQDLVEEILLRLEDYKVSGD